MDTSPLLKRFVDSVKSQLGDKVRKIVVYGSYARGEANEESDIDIMVMMEAEPGELRQYREALLDIQVDLSLEFGVLVSVVLQSRTEFEHWLPAIPFFQNVDREGIGIYG